MLNGVARRRLGSMVPSVVVIFMICLAVAWPVYADSDAQKLDDANQLFREALALKKEGKPDAACDTYEKAVRIHRGILAEDDDGLLDMLKKSFERKLASAPIDLHALEGLGFIHSVGLGEPEAALNYYKRLLAVVKDEKVRQKTQYLVDRLQAEKEITRQFHSDVSAKAREDRLREWAEVEKQQALSSLADQKQDVETRLNDAQSRKEQLTARIPQLEDEVKDLRDQDESNTRLWNTMKNEHYRRQYRAAREAVGVKDPELAELRRQLIQATDEVKMLSRDLELVEKQVVDRANAARVAPASPSGTGSSAAPADPGEPPAEQGSGSSAATGAAVGSDAGSSSGPPSDTGTDTGAATVDGTDTGSGSGSGSDPVIPSDALGSGAGNNPDFPNN